MSFAIEKQGEIVVVDVEGQLIVGNRQELKQRVLDELEKGERKFLIDFSQTGYIDSSGLGELALAFCAAGSPQDQARISHVLNEHGRANFARAYLNERGLSHWADQLETLNTERTDHEQLHLEFDSNPDEVSASAT